MKKIWLILCIFLIVPVYGQDLPFSEITELKTYEDHYTVEKTVQVYIKENNSYKTENRIVSVNIAPQEFAYSQGQDIKDYFCHILVAITITKEDGKTSEDFLSYLNFDSSKRQLFWDHAGFSQADRAGESFSESRSLVVTDQDLKVTLSLMQFTLSPYSCSDCETDADSYIVFIDLIRFRLDIIYTQSQLDAIEGMQEDMEKYGDAQEYVAAAQQYFQQGDFEKAKNEFQKAKDTFDEIGDTENSDEMQEQINECISYKAAADNLKEGIRLFEEAANTSDYQVAINTFEEARSYFQRAKTEFDGVEDTNKSDECDSWIERCDDEIENLKGVGTLRERLIYIILAIVVVAGAGIFMKQLGKGKGKGKGKPAAPAARGISLKAVNAQTGQETMIEVQPTDRIGKVRQVAATNLGIVPSALLYNGKECPPDWSVKDCGLHDNAVVTVVPKGMEETKLYGEKDDRAEKLEKLELRYKEGRISQELYESLKKKLESE